MFAKQSQNLTTKKRRRQGRHRANRPSPPLPQNQSGTTRLHRNRNPRRRNPRRFRAKRRRRGNPNRRETRKHQGRKNATTPYGRACYRVRARNSSAQDLSGSRRRRLSRTKRPACAPSGERAQVVIEKSGLEEDQGLEPAHRRLRRKEVSGPGLAVRVTIVI